MNSSQKVREAFVQVDTHITKLETLTKTIHFEGETARLLYNPMTHDLCQVFEYIGSEDSEGFAKVAAHVHVKSDELFYVVTGVLTFDDGVVLSTGKYRLIPAGTVHSCKLSQNGKAIIIARPPEPEYHID